MTWELWLSLGLFVLLLVASGFARKFFKELKEASGATTDLISFIHDMLADGQVTPDEQKTLAEKVRILLKEGKDVIDMVKELINLIATRNIRKP